MAQDDLHIIIYKVLAYLYDCMKSDREPENDELSANGVLFGGVPEGYWTSIWSEMADNGFVKGVGIVHYDNSPHVLLQSPSITLGGYEYMRENKLMKRALKTLQDAKSTLPFI